MTSQQKGPNFSAGLDQATQGMSGVTGGLKDAFDPDSDAKTNAAGSKAMMEGAMQTGFGVAQMGMAAVLQVTLVVIAVSLLGAKSPFEVFLRRRIGSRYLSEMVLIPTLMFYSGFLVYYWKFAPEEISAHGFYAITIVIILFLARYVDCIVSGIQRQYNGIPSHSRYKGDTMTLFSSVDQKLAQLGLHFKIALLVIEPLIVICLCWLLSLILFEFLIIGAVASGSMVLFHLIEAIDAHSKQLDQQDALIDAQAERQSFLNSRNGRNSEYIGNAHSL